MELDIDVESGYTPAEINEEMHRALITAMIELGKSKRNEDTVFRLSEIEASYRWWRRELTRD